MILICNRRRSRYVDSSFHPLFLLLADKHSPQFAESDFAAQARLQATHFGQNLQAGARGAADQFNRFVEGPDDGRTSNRRSRIEPERREFWDDFSSLAEQESSTHQRSSSRSGVIGTAAMRKGPATSSSLANSSTPAVAGDTVVSSSGVIGVEGGGNAVPPSPAKEKEKEDWDENW